MQSERTRGAGELLEELGRCLSRVIAEQDAADLVMPELEPLLARLACGRCRRAWRRPGAPRS